MLTKRSHVNVACPLLVLVTVLLIALFVGLSAQATQRPLTRLALRIR